MRYAWMLGFVFVASCRFGSLPRQNYHVEVPYEDLVRYTEDARHRLEIWQAGLGEGLSVEFVQSLEWREFASTGKTTCYFRTPDRIEIGDDKWASGCVPHEIGHAYLYSIKYRDWCNYEHQQENWKTC